MTIISPIEIASGQRNGEIIWVCDIRKPDLHKKAIRSVQPTRVMVRPISECTQRIYYSESFLSPLNKKDEPLSKVIKVYDNTGYRSYAGIGLFGFTTEEECRGHFATQCKEIIDMLEIAKKAVVIGYDNEIVNLEKMMS
jgi:hypothetical protein